MPSVDDSAELAYRWSGPTTQSTTPIVLLHGLGDSGDCWPDAVRRWSASHRVVGVDALGHGLSPRFTAAQLSAPDPMEEMYAATLALVSRVASEAGPVLLVGHSMGGGIGTALAARHPELLRAAVLEEPAWRDRVERVQLGAVIDERIADSRRFRDDPVGALAAGRRDNPRWPEVEFEPWARAKTQVDLDFLALGVASLDRPWQDLVAAIGVPTLVVIGGQSTLITADALSQAAALGHAHVRIEVVPDAGHCVRRDLPDTFHGLVDPWLAAHA